MVKDKRPRTSARHHAEKTANNETSQDFIIGRHAATAALKGEQAINKVFLQEGLKADAIKEIEQLAKKRKIIVSHVPKSKLDLLTDAQNHQGVVVAISAYEYATIDDLFENARQKGEDPFFLILDGIEDPHNLGSIMRTADATGVHGIIIPKRRAVQLTSTVAKTSTGAIEYVPVARVTNLVQTVEKLKEQGMWIFGTDMDGQDYRQWNAKGPTALVIGNEGKGIAPLLKKSCDQMLTIPMVGHVQSLNASVAASLMMYQAFTSRGL